jgi:tRNA U34 5-methylaminomethyl-2-thiouridine-forming methyltransferase MnmC
MLGFWMASPPLKTPQMWQADLLSDVAKHTKTGEWTAATYTAAGFVRRGLQAAGFDVETARVTAPKDI